MALDRSWGSGSTWPWLAALGLIQLMAAVAAIQFGALWVWAPAAVLVAVTALLFPQLGVLILTITIYFRWRIPGTTGVYPSDIVAFLVIGGVVANRLANGRWPVVASVANAPLAAILAVFALSLIGAFDTVKGTVNWLRHVQLFCLLVAVVTIMDKQAIQRVLRWMLILAFIFSCRNILVFVVTGGQERILGPAGAFFPFFLTLTAIHALAAAVLADHARQRWGWMILAIVYMLAQICSLTRESWLQLMLTFVVMSVTLFRWAERENQPLVKRRLRALAISGLVLIAVVLSNGIPLLSRPAERVMSAVEGRSTSIVLRLFLWRTGVHAFMDSPLLGAGIGQVQRWDQFLPFWRFDPIAMHTRGLGAHNDLITYAAETGLLGLAALFWLFWRLNKTARDAWRRMREPTDVLPLLVLWMALWAFILRFFFGTHTFYSTAGIVTALYCGMLVRYCLDLQTTPKADVGHDHRP